MAGIRISRPERVIYPDLGVTKIDLARFYESLGAWIVPHVHGRPLTLVHCPEGLRGECRYMRHTRVWGPSALRRIRIQEKTKLGEYLVANDLTAVVALVQIGVVEIHTWNSTVDDIERPNRIVWDLDPGPRVPWSTVIAAARQLRGVLATLGLESWVKTTGGRGLHVVVPLRRERDWRDCLVFARGVAEALARAHPARYTTGFAKRGRESKILIDYLRNNRTNTSIAAFSTRARPGALVSMPLAWEALSERRPPSTFSVPRLPRILSRMRRDPWTGYWTCRQRITRAAAAALHSL